MVTPVRDREAVEQAVARGSEALKQGQLEAAAHAFAAALALDPESTKILALYGLALFRAGHFARARPIYEQLVERAATDASHRLNLGLVYLKLGDGELAIHALEASRALDPSQGRAVSYLGLAYARAGRYAEAYRSFLIARQHELASEIEVNLTAAERTGIQSQLGVGPPSAMAAADGPRADARPATISQPPPPRTFAQPAAMRDAAPAPARPAQPPHSLGTGGPTQSSPEIVIEHRDDALPQPRLTDSQMFVLPTTPSAVPAPRPGDLSMVSQAVAAVEPSPVTAPRTASGGTAPRPLSELATEDLVRPDEGEDAFELTTTGALVIRVSERVYARIAGVHVTSGDLAYEPATRRSRGHQTDEAFDYGGLPLRSITGTGYLIASPGEHVFAAVALDDDILYLREDLVFAFEGSLRWENGNVPGLRGKLPVVQFRGDGGLVVRSMQPLMRVKLPPQGVLYVDAERIAGWIGRVIPRAVVPPGGGPLGAMCVECTGEGIVLVEAAPALGSPATSLPVTAAAAPASPRSARTTGRFPPPPPGPAPRAGAITEVTAQAAARVGGAPDADLDHPVDAHANADADADAEMTPELADLGRALAESDAAGAPTADDSDVVPPGRDEF